jgi:hypothetical protein
MPKNLLFVLDPKCGFGGNNYNFNMLQFFLIAGQNVTVRIVGREPWDIDQELGVKIECLE